MPVVNVAALAEASKRRNISGQAKDKDAAECIGRPLNEENVSRSQPIRSFKHLAEIVCTTESTIEFLRSIGLLPKSMKCRNCEDTLLSERTVPRIKDKKMFYCLKCKKMCSIRMIFRENSVILGRHTYYIVLLEYWCPLFHD